MDADDSKWSMFWSTPSKLDAQIRKAADIPLQYINLASSLEGQQNLFSAVWRDDPTNAGTRVIHGVSVPVMSTIGKTLLSNGFRPISICVSGGEGEQMTAAAVWLLPEDFGGR